MTILLSTITSIHIYPRLQMLILKQPQPLQQCSKNTTGLIFDDFFQRYHLIILCQLLPEHIPPPPPHSLQGLINSCPSAFECGVSGEKGTVRNQSNDRNP